MDLTLLPVANESIVSNTRIAGATRPPSIPAIGRIPEFEFPHSARLVTPAQFGAVLATRPVARTSRFSVHLRPGGDAGWRLGLVVPKRWLPKAVSRNAAKRAWREAFRLHRPALENMGSGHDILVRLVAKPQAVDIVSLREICRQDASDLLEQLIARFVRPEPPKTCAPP